MVQRSGRAVQYVESAIDEDGVHPADADTIALTALGRPELVITDRGVEQSVAVLYRLAGLAVGGVPVRPGDLHVVEDLEVCLVEVRDCPGWVQRAGERYGCRARAPPALWADCTGVGCRVRGWGMRGP
ncbi:hypothetical protein M2284_002809 [Rhodococcus sp. LBL1]|nr:hypothetical protein [Rhodococcus sp. LBL1]MDH6684526.1 hypothetical protein [Rhodococcus sp. LBL2]